MSITNYEGGLASMGVPLPSSGFTRFNGRPHLFVHGQYGNDGFPGTDTSQPLKTMAKAFALVQSGGTIHLNGSITEQLSTPAGIFDVTVIGEGNRPRHADAHTSSGLNVQGGRAGATWKAPTSPTATTPLVKVRQQGWRFVNILFAPPSDAAAISFIRDAAAGDSERDGSHGEVVGCRFAGGQDGILFAGTENLFDVLICNNTFNDQTGVSIKGGYCYRALIENNVFGQNANHIVLACTQSNIIRNILNSWTTAAIDLNGGGGLNVITENYLSGTYASTQYRKANANDEWAGNWNTLSGGITVSDPA